MDIRVVLTETDPKLGKRGEVIKVSSGYAQNFLFPHKKAVLATPAALKGFEAEKARQAKDEAEHLAKARQTAERISKTPLALDVMAGEGDKLYGAVTAHDIQEALAAKGIAVEKRDIHLQEPIKRLGQHDVALKLHPDVAVTLKLTVQKKQ